MALPIRAQDRTDSLKRELEKELDDKDRIRVLIELSKLYQYVDFDQAQMYAEDAVQLAEQSVSDEVDILAFENLATLFTISGDYSSALRYDNLSLQHSIRTGDSLNITVNYNNIANDYYDLGDYDEAYYYFTQSYRVARLINDSLRMTIALHNVGRVFKELGQYDRALDHFHISQDFSRQIGDIEGIPYSLDEIGDVLLRKHEYDSALVTLEQALEMTREMNIRVLEPRTLIKIASVWMHKGEFRKALAYYDTTYGLHEKTNNRYGMGEVELGRGEVYIAQQRYDEAMPYINRALEIARETNARVLEINGYHKLSTLVERKGDYKTSLNYYKRYKALEDSLFSQDMHEKLLRDQLRFETEAKDTQIAALSHARDLSDDEIKRKDFINNILVVVMALSVILLITVYRSGRRRRQINMLLLQHQKDMEKRSEELERLNQVKDKFFSIISHDLRSPINALAGLLDLLDKGAVGRDELPKHVAELKTRFNHTRTLLNNLLDWTLLQMDKLNLQASKIELRKIVDENIQLLSSVQTKPIRLINEIPHNAIAFADSNTVNLVIRNLMTNAMKFTNEGGSVIIGAKEAGVEWHIHVTDTGIGMAEDVLQILFDKTAPYTTRGTANEKGTGLGLILCKEFVEKNGGSIWVESKPGRGSKFTFSLPRGN